MDQFWTISGPRNIPNTQNDQNGWKHEYGNMQAERRHLFGVLGQKCIIAVFAKSGKMAIFRSFPTPQNEIPPNIPESGHFGPSDPEIRDLRSSDPRSQILRSKISDPQIVRSKVSIWRAPLESDKIDQFRDRKIVVLTPKRKTSFLTCFGRFWHFWIEVKCR